MVQTVQSILLSNHRRLDLMAKIDKSQYTKQEWKKIKEQRRLEKHGTTAKTVFDPDDDHSQIYILCLKHGTKYSSEYVNRLYNMCKRWCSLDFKFVCLTDNADQLNSDIMVLPIPSGLSGWWCKPYMYSKELPIQGTILYMDLDVVLSANIDKLITYQPNHWCTIRDFTRAMRPKWPRYNSSIVRFKTGELDFVWDNYIKNPVAIQRHFFGDQDYLYDETHQKKGAMLYPDSWIQSWKWEVRKSKQLTIGGTKGKRKFTQIENVKPRVECCVCVFHGDPNPHNCDDPWVKENWV
jgi:hypothetical protein